MRVGACEAVINIQGYGLLRPPFTLKIRVNNLYIPIMVKKASSLILLEQLKSGHGGFVDNCLILRHHCMPQLEC